MADKAEIAVVRRTYSGAEGNRVKAGTRFAIGKEVGGLVVISRARYEQMRQQGIMRAFGDEDTKGPATVRPSRPLARTVTTMEGSGSASARSIREATRRRAKQTETPGAPKQTAGPKNSTSVGSQTGQAPASSSSPGGQASKGSTSGSSKRRGSRGAAPGEVPGAQPSASSPSTTR